MSSAPSSLYIKQAWGWVLGAHDEALHHQQAALRHWLPFRRKHLRRKGAPLSAMGVTGEGEGVPGGAACLSVLPSDTGSAALGANYWVCSVQLALA